MELKISEKFNGVVSISINHQNVYIKSFGYRDLANEIHNNQKTRFATASAGKTFVAVGILQLIEKGLINFDSTIQDLIPIDWKAIDPEITVLQLLTHTSGIPDYFNESVMEEYSDLWAEFPNYNLRKSTDLFPLFIDQPMMHEKNTVFQYNNTGYVVLGHIIERIMNQSFDEYLRENVFSISNMSKTGYFELDRLPNNCANHYIYDQQKKEYYTNIYSIDVKGSGAGGVFTCATDIENFWEALLNNKLLSEEMTQKMLSVHAIQEKDNHYGLGIWFNRQSTSGQQPFFNGFDPGVTFVSEFDRNTNTSITLFSNFEDNVWQELTSIKQQLAVIKDK